MRFVLTSPIRSFKSDVRTSALRNIQILKCTRLTSDVKKREHYSNLDVRMSALKKLYSDMVAMFHSMIEVVLKNLTPMTSMSKRVRQWLTLETQTLDVGNFCIDKRRRAAATYLHCDPWGHRMIHREFEVCANDAENFGKIIAKEYLPWTPGREQVFISFSWKRMLPEFDHCDDYLHLREPARKTGDQGVHSSLSHGNLFIIYCLSLKITGFRISASG